MTMEGFGVRSLIPDESLDGYGFHPDLLGPLPNAFLVRPAYPLLGHAYREAGYPSPAIVRIEIGASEFTEQLRRLLIWQGAYDAIISGIGRAGGTPSPNVQFLFRWRLVGSSAEWTEVPGTVLGVSLSTTESTVTEGARVIGQVIVEDRRLDPTGTEYDAAIPDLPDTDDIVEFFLIGPIAPDKDHEVYIDSGNLAGGLTAGEFTRNVYQGLYSARDPNTGAVIPTGIRFDEVALLQMDTPVRIRLREPIENARDWLQRYIYAPLGWCPALDREGRISPVSQVPPDDVSSLYVLDNDNTEASPDWNAGERVINVVRFTYPRDYSVGPPDPPPPTSAGEERQHMVEEREIVVEYRLEGSVERHGEKILELDGSAFRAIGRPAEDAEEATLPPGPTKPLRSLDVERRKRRLGARNDAPLTETPVIAPAVSIVPVEDYIEDEVGYGLAQDRQAVILERWGLGAPSMNLTVMREAIPDLRAGDWVLLNLTWFPDYLTGRRGLTGLAQVIALSDLDCAWRRLTVEQVLESDAS